MSSDSAVDYDVIVVGAGGAGMTAAIVAADEGARVALLEAWDRVGGSTALAGGYVYAVGTRQQQEQGVADSPRQLMADIRALNGDSIDADVLERFAQDCAAAVAWLEQLGVVFPTAKLVSPDGRMLPRAHEPVGFGYDIAQRLDTAVSQRDIDLALNSRVEQLLADPDGSICGVRVDGADVRSRAVILACGGIGGAPELLDRFCPKSSRAGDWRWHVGCETNRGDGLRMGEAVGARIAGRDSGLFLMTPNFSHDLEVIGPAWVLLVNSKGERIVREGGAYWEVSEALEAQEDGLGFAIFSHEQMLAAQPDPRVLEALATGSITLNWTPDALQAQLGTGKVKKADTIEALAQEADIDPSQLVPTVQRYNDLAERGRDEDYGKAPASLRALQKPPFYAVEVRPAIAIVTGAGPAIDGRARVLRQDGQVLPGLYAAGETTGNVYGRHYVGSGYAICSAITFGRVAGEEAALFAQSHA